MKAIVAVMLGALLLSSCTTGELEPIPGSITYNGQPRTKLTKAPVGSPVEHRFIGPMGERVYETYIIMPDRSLKLVQRRRQNMFLDPS